MKNWLAWSLVCAIVMGGLLTAPTLAQFNQQLLTRIAAGGGGLSISFVAATNPATDYYNGGTTNSLTESYTVTTGANPNGMLVVCAQGDNLIGGANDVTGVTYNAVAMTRDAAYTSGTVSGNAMIYIYRMLNPPSGAHNIVLSSTTNHNLLLSAGEYNGVAATNPVDNTKTWENTGSQPSTFTTTMSPTQAGSWVIDCRVSSSSINYSTVVGGTLRSTSGPTYNNPVSVDTGAYTSGATYGVTMSTCNAGTCTIGAVSVAYKHG
jgi:hypothetical protein